MMKVARLLCVLWACGPMALEAGAAESPAHNGASVAAADMGQAASGTALGRDTRIKAGRPAAQESTQTGSSTAAGSKGRNAAAAASPRRVSVTPPHAAGPLARSNADRLHSLHPAKERGRVAPNPNRHVGPTAAAASGKVSARGQGVPGASSQAPPTPPVATSAAQVPSSLPVATSVARIPPNVTPMVRTSSIGGPRAAGPGRLGGPPTGRTAHNGTISGTQLHHKF
jgi:hypothetical protein